MDKRSMCLFGSDALRCGLGLAVLPLAAVVLAVAVGVALLDQALHPDEWQINPTFRDWDE